MDYQFTCFPPQPSSIFKEFSQKLHSYFKKIKGLSRTHRKDVIVSVSPPQKWWCFFREPEEFKIMCGFWIIILWNHPEIVVEGDLNFSSLFFYCHGMNGVGLMEKCCVKLTGLKIGYRFKDQLDSFLFQCIIFYEFLLICGIFFRNFDGLLYDFDLF